MADKRITELNPLSAGAVESIADVLAIADVSAGETKKITPVALIAGAAGGLPPDTIDGSVIIDNSIEGAKLAEDSVTTRELAPDACYTENYLNKSVTQAKLADGAVGSDQIIDGSITGDKLSPDAISDAAIADRSLDGIKLKLNTLTQDELGPDCVGASELADNSVDTTAIVDAALSTPKYQNASVTDEKLASGIDGGKLSNGSVGTNQLADGSVTSDKLAGDIPLSKLPDAPQNTVLAGSNGGGSGPATFRSLASADLPAATTAANGAVNVPPAGGLSVDIGGGLSIANTVAPGTNPVVTYDANGLITAGRALQPSDLPAPSGGELGAVKAGAGINIAADGTISQALTGVSAGTYSKVTVDNMGNVTTGGQLESSDLPPIEIDQISGEISGGQLADGSVTRPKLANYATSYIQEDQPPLNAQYIGCQWLQESTARLSMWNGNSWLSVGIGRMSAENLRYCGIFDASTGNITGVTKYGTEAGLNIGDPIPAATDDLTGVYVVCEVPGDGTAVTPGVSYAAGNWCLCNGETGGWVKINQTGGSGGGGGATRLNDLVDVTITGGQEDDILQQNDSGMYVNVRVLSAGTY